MLTGGPSGATLTIRVTPRGGRDAVEGRAVDTSGAAHLKVRVAAPADKGAANAAALAVLAKAIGAPKSALRLVSGAAARIKRVAVDAPVEDVAAALGLPIDASDRADPGAVAREARR